MRLTESNLILKLIKSSGNFARKLVAQTSTGHQRANAEHFLWNHMTCFANTKEHILN